MVTVVSRVSSPTTLLTSPDSQTESFHPEVNGIKPSDQPVGIGVTCKETVSVYNSCYDLNCFSRIFFRGSLFGGGKRERERWGRVDKVGFGIPRAWLHYLLV